MLFKEKGYDEFLAEKIARADEDIKAGRVKPWEEVRKELEEHLAQKAKELEQMEQELTYA